MGVHHGGLFLGWLLVWPAWADDGRLCPEPHDATVRVATLNAWGLPFPIAPRRPQRMYDMTRWLTEQAFDVVGLQEVWWGARRFLDIEGLAFPNSGGDSGLALLTDLPAQAPEVTAFPTARGWDRLKAKGLLEAQVEIPDAGPVWVLVTHMQSGSSPRSARVRQQQVEQIVEALERLPGPALLLGDFNFYADHPIDREGKERLATQNLVDVAAHLGAKASTYRASSQRYDRIYVRGAEALCLEPLQVEVVRYGETLPVLSDHYPVRAELGVVIPDVPVAELEEGEGER